MHFESSPFASDGTMPESPSDEALTAGTSFQKTHHEKLRSIEALLNDAVADATDLASDPVALHLHPDEKVDVLDLVSTSNNLFNKLVITFASICDEVDEMVRTARSQFFPALALFGRSRDDVDHSVTFGTAEAELGQLLPLAQQVANFVERCGDITLNLVHQLCALYSGKGRLYQAVYKNVQLQPVFDCLADLFAILITLDCVVDENVVLSEAWNKFKTLAPVVHSSPEMYGLQPDQAERFERMLVNLNSGVMSGMAFSTCIDQDFNVAPGDGALPMNVSSNTVLRTELMARISKMLDTCVKTIGTPTETIEKRRLVGVYGLYALSRRLLPPAVRPAKDVYRKLWRVQETVPMVPLHGQAYFMADQFLLANARFKCDGLKPKRPAEFRKDRAKKMGEKLESLVNGLYQRLTVWLVQMESLFAPAQAAEPSVELVRERGRLMLEGILLAYQGKNMWKTFLSLHTETQSAVKKRMVQPLSLCVELLKVIEFTFRRKNACIAETQSLMLRHMANEIVAVFRPLRSRLEGAKLSDPKRELLAAIDLLEGSVLSSESFSYTRRVIMELALCVALMRGSPMGSQQKLVERTMWILGVLGDWQHHIREACDCSDLFWSQELLPAILTNAYERPQQVNRIHYILAAYGDAGRMLEAAESRILEAAAAAGAPLPTSKRNIAGELYKTAVVEAVHDFIIKPTQRLVESDLRKHVASVRLAKHEYNPKHPSESRPPLCPVLFLRPVRVFDQTIDIKLIVTHYLRTTFYNLTTVALSDWKTYGEMANLARDKFGIELADSHLPMGELDQGIDVLEIMRNIHKFVRRFNYNQNQQMFVEKRSDRGAKHLNVVNIDSISASIRSHGTGMMNTTVSFVFGFLKRKFFLFSQFLFDMHIKSHLSRERRFFKRNKKTLGNKYPYDNAFQFTRDVMELGMDGNQSFLDKFRILITEIGNALGYVRMVRSAGMHVCSEAVQFIPDLQHVLSFEHYAGKGDADDEGDEKGADLSPATVGAAKTLDRVVGNLLDNLQDESDFLQVLVGIFQRNMSGDKYAHLKNFVYIIPSLTINFISSIRVAKDSMTKSVKGRETYFTDDGFAIGIAYILTILKQNKAFDSLHWWDSINLHFQQVEQDLKVRADKLGRAKRGRSEELDEIAFKGKRLRTQQHEVRMLYFSFAGAQIFFRNDDKSGKEPPAAPPSAEAGAGAGAGAGQ